LACLPACGDDCLCCQRDSEGRFDEGLSGNEYFDDRYYTHDCFNNVFSPNRHLAPCNDAPIKDVDHPQLQIANRTETADH